MPFVQEVSDEEVNSLTTSILIRYGIDFTCYEPKSLRRRVIRILNLYDLSSIHELWVKFLREPDFIQLFMNQISVGMTSMFRDPKFWINLKQIFVSELADKNAINVWHAGCSTGEEIYSLGILLQECKLQQKTRALATDINVHALEEARAGLYHKIKMIGNEANYTAFNSVQPFAKYYETDAKHATLDPQLIKHATLGYHNLITDPARGTFDLILCRNVMIYFDAQAKTKLLAKFHAALNPGGFFAIGMFDTMSHLIDNKMFKLVNEEAKIFQKV